MLVHSSHEAGVLETSEERLLQRAFDFGDIHISAVMQPRVEVDAIALDTPLPELLERASTGHYSRYPVYRESIDRVVGVLHTKDLLARIVRQPEFAERGGCFRSIVGAADAAVLPEMASVDRVLEQMQRTKTHVTIVIDDSAAWRALRRWRISSKN